MYQTLRRILFLLSPEKAHHLSMNFFHAACANPVLKKILTRRFQPRNKAVNVFGISFKNLIGLGAGFDKNAKYLRELEVMGFGFVEIGTVTPKRQSGNEQPRLFRLPQDKALINRMGFNNDGVEVIADRLKLWWQKNHSKSGRMIIGGNIGKNKVTPNEDAWKDYEKCFLMLHPYVDFFVVNVSSPNTPGLRELQEKESLRKILVHLQTLDQTITQSKPILLKIAPDLSPEQIDDVIDLASEIKLDGLVVSNTTINREGLTTPVGEVAQMGAGGLSGAPVRERSTEILRYIHEKTSGRIPIIGSGGVFTGADAKEKMSAGASLIEVWTGFIYEGPFIVKKILEQL
ncbi:MAG: quinone-dependent dihydroorotate dehydrogenase [Flavisolibacter sp.]